MCANKANLAPSDLMLLRRLFSKAWSRYCSTVKVCFGQNVFVVVHIGINDVRNKSTLQAIGGLSPGDCEPISGCNTTSVLLPPCCLSCCFYYCTRLIVVMTLIWADTSEISLTLTPSVERAEILSIGVSRITNSVLNPTVFHGDVNSSESFKHCCVVFPR